MQQIVCENLTLGYDTKIILKDLNFEICKGDYLCILGENGTGKSTLIKSIAGLIKAMSGKILFENGTTSRDCGYLTQQSEIQRDFPATVKEIVMSGCQNRTGFRPFYNKAEKQMAKEAMEKLSITNFAKTCYKELSGGQQQRVLLARSFCAMKKILLLDEPVSGLDVNVSQEFYKILADLNNQEDITIVMISHDIESAVKYADKILHIGKKNFFGSKKDYIKSEIYSSFRNTIGE